MPMAGQPARATRSRAAARALQPSLTGFELFILGLVVAMAADIALFVWIVVREFAR